VGYAALQTAGAEVVAIVVAPLSAVEGWCRSFNLSYPVLADSDHRVSEAFGVYDIFGAGLAGPAVFVVAPDGSVLWSHVGAAPVDPVGADVIRSQLP
jgi:peroxiredoxin Q/BCP